MTTTRCPKCGLPAVGADKVCRSIMHDGVGCGDVSEYMNLPEKAAEYMAARPARPPLWSMATPASSKRRHPRVTPRASKRIARLPPQSFKRTMATAESAEINIAKGIRELGASGRFWINQRAFAKAAGAVDDDARNAKGALTASEKYMQLWSRTRGANRLGVTKEDQGRHQSYPICWNDGTVKAMGRCAYFDIGAAVSEECVKGSMATQLALAAKIRELPQPLNEEAIYQCVVASDGALENVFSGTAGRELRHLIPLFLKAECIELETFLI
jgi:hypothetical protein